MILKGKKILFFAPAFFEYEKKIAKKMIELGAHVDYYDERSITKNFEKALLKISPLIFRRKTLKYYQSIIKGICGNDYDYVFVIKCEMMPINVIKKMKEIFKNAVFCLYLYDSFKNIKGIKSKIKYFDRVLSFDNKDTKNSNSIIFRPLFFADEFRQEVFSTKKYIYDICFIGTIHSDRYRIIKTIKDIADKNNYTSFFFCYLQSKFIYHFYKFTKREFWGTKKNQFNYNKISSVDIAKIIDGTRVVIDIQHPKQDGLTIRTIEMIGMNKKLITTNQNIKQYDFYNTQNIAVIDRNDVVIPEGFFDKPYQKINDEIYNRYTLESWIIDVLGLERGSNE